MTPLRILVIDDDPILSDSIKKIIELHDHDVRQAHTIAESLAIAAEFSPHIAYVDLRLDDESGLDVIRHFSNDYPDIICVVMTAFGDFNTAVQALRRGARDYLRKPITPDVIDGTLERCGEEVRIRKHRKGVEKKLKASEQRFETLFQSSTQGILVHRNFKPIYANSSILDFLGLGSLEELLAYDSTDVFLEPEDQIQIRRYHEDRLSGKPAPHNYEMRVRDTLGTIKWVLNHSFLIDWYGISAVCTTFTDISEIKRNEIELEKARTHAEEANRAKSKFLSSMSHELHTPMNAVLGFAQILKSDLVGKGNKDQKICVDQILESGGHLLSLIDKILLFAGVEDNLTQPIFAETALEELIQGCIHKTWKEAEKLRLTISLDTAVLSTPVVLVDGQILEQCLLALLNNAAAYNREMGWIAVKAETMEDGVRISVTDGGLGIPEKRKDDVFVPFQRCGMENSAISGTGIGLSIAQKQAGLIGATIGFKSQYGKGSTFWLDLKTPSENRVN